MSMKKKTKKPTQLVHDDPAGKKISKGDIKKIAWFVHLVKLEK